MKISFHGAARTVTGSKHLITLKNGKKFYWIVGYFKEWEKYGGIKCAFWI